MSKSTYNKIKKADTSEIQKSGEIQNINILVLAATFLSVTLIC